MMRTTCPRRIPKHRATGSCIWMRGSCVSFTLYRSRRVFFCSSLRRMCSGTSTWSVMLTRSSDSWNCSM